VNTLRLISSAEDRQLNERMSLIPTNYNLTWPTYSDHTASMLSQMRNCNNFADVTLVCDDKKQIRAHRNVLSACSGFFKDILLINLQSVQHPVVFLRGVHSEELNTILQFVYEGQVSVGQDKFMKLYEVAKSLEIVELILIIQLSMFNEDTETNTPIKNESQETVSQETNDISNYFKSDDDIESNSPKKKAIINNDTHNCSSEEEANSHENKQLPTKQPENPDDSKYYCNQCEYYCSTKNEIDAHLNVHQGPKHTCHICGRAYKKKFDLQIHIRSEHEGIYYECDLCDYKNSEARKLKQHKESKHEGIRYACGKCDFKATQTRHLKYHNESVHEGIRFTCTECYQQFTKPAKLKQHIRSIHEGIKLSCKLCDYKTNYNSELYKHKRSKHEGINHACDYCGKLFSEKTNMMKHIQYKHEGVRHDCQLCEYKATTRGSLKNHVKSKHEGSCEAQGKGKA